jgi:hypothetical protein
MLTPEQELRAALKRNDELYQARVNDLESQLVEALARNAKLVEENEKLKDMNNVIAEENQRLRNDGEEWDAMVEENSKLTQTIEMLKLAAQASKMERTPHESETERELRKENANLRELVIKSLPHVEDAYEQYAYFCQADKVKQCKDWLERARKEVK